MRISLSELVRLRFGFVTAKVNLVAGDDLAEALDWCEKNRAEFLIARLPTDQIQMVQAMERAGFMLSDTLVYFRKKNLETIASDLPTGYSWRLAQTGDHAEVEELAMKTFAGYTGHYHADSKLKKIDSDLVYSSWAANSCVDKQLADAVILIENDQKIAAFATVKKVETYMSEGILFGVAPEHQGKSLYAALMSLAQQWSTNATLSQMIVSTQITNLAVQKVWCRQGFEPHQSFYTFHKWFAR